MKKKVKAYNLSEKVIEKLEALAKKKDRSVSWVVNSLLEEKLKA